MSLRSYLYVPGNQEHLLKKALRYQADALILDLEDSVPAAEKRHARYTIGAFIQTLPKRDRPLVFVRVNSGEMALEDLEVLSGDKSADGLMLPKCESPSQIRHIDKALAALERSTRIPIGTILVIPLIETVAGLYACKDMASASQRVRRLAFGATDFITDLGGRATRSRQETLFARSMLVAQSRALGLAPPIAHVFTPFRDIEGLEKACIEDRALGFFGRTCIHPRQVEKVNAVFSYTNEEILQAQNIIAAYKAANEIGRGTALMKDGTFVDEAVVKRAREVLAEGGR